MYAIGIDVGGTSVKVGLINSNGEVVDNFNYPINPKEKGLVTLKSIAKKINEYQKKYHLKGIGIGMPGIIDSDTGKLILSSTTLNNWKGISITDTLSKLTSLKVVMSNDANVAALAEAKFGKYRDKSLLLTLTLGTGVGGGIVANHKLVEGNKGQGAELGHISIDMNGRKCGCGRKGCLETYASATALINDTKALLKKYPHSILSKQKLNGEIIWKAYKKKDPAAVVAVNNYIHYLAEGILNYCVIFRPDVILLSGGIAKAGNLLLNPLRQYVKERFYGIKGAAPVIIDIASLKYDSGIIGAASLIFN